MLDILAIAPRILDVPAEHVHAKARMRSRGGSQYGKQGAGKGGSGERANIARRRLPLIEEGGLTFAVNFDDYLDVGIFLDHRVTRNLVREHAKQARRFLNLFAYTGTATCYAADGGVEETVTVDLSNTYLDWAERNMRQNGFVGPQHHFGARRRARLDSRPAPDAQPLGLDLCRPAHVLELVQDGPPHLGCPARPC